MSGVRKAASQPDFNPMDKPTGVGRVVLACQHSIRALVWLSKNEAAFRQEIVLLLVSLMILLVWHISLIEKALLLSSVLFVLFAEMVNTAVEVTIDRIGLERHPLSGLAKDLGSACVFLAMCIAALLWLAVLISSA